MTGSRRRLDPYEGLRKEQGIRFSFFLGSFAAAHRRHATETSARIDSSRLAPDLHEAAFIKDSMTSFVTGIVSDVRVLFNLYAGCLGAKVKVTKALSPSMEGRRATTTRSASACSTGVRN